MNRCFWLWHALFPALLFIAAALVCARTDLDLQVANRFFDVATGRWPYRDAWLTHTLLHDRGQLTIKLIGAGILLFWLCAWCWPRFRGYRRPASYLVLAIGLSTGLVSLGKAVSPVDCPWHLQRYGGEKPYIKLYAERPPSAKGGHCFPGGHSSGGFALFAFYFFWRERRPCLARFALSTALLVGSVFALAQWARGAHFPSHDFYSAAICWGVCLGLYSAILRPTPEAKAISHRAANVFSSDTPTEGG